MDLEARAGHVLTVQPTIVPALLQTVAYARAVLELADVTSQDIAAAVALRLRRRELLHDPAKRFGFVLTEAALRWPASDAHVMAAQYDRIAQISTLPNVTVGVIPLGRQVSALPWCDINLYEDLVDPADLADTDRLLYALAAGVLSLAVSADRLDDRAAEVRTALESKL